MWVEKDDDDEDCDNDDSDLKFHNSNVNDTFKEMRS